MYIQKHIQVRKRTKQIKLNARLSRANLFHEEEVFDRNEQKKIRKILYLCKVTANDFS